MKTLYYQQGDVLLKKVTALPEGCTKLTTKVLQLGEVTGHKHQFLAPAARGEASSEGTVTVYVSPEFAGQEQTITPDEGKFVVIEGDTAYLRHEEHKPIGVEPGIYQVDIVREFDYDTMESRRVVD